MAVVAAVIGAVAIAQHHHHVQLAAMAAVPHVAIIQRHHHVHLAGMDADRIAQASAPRSVRSKLLWVVPVAQMSVREIHNNLATPAQKVVILVVIMPVITLVAVAVHILVKIHANLVKEDVEILVQVMLSR